MRVVGIGRRARFRPTAGTPTGEVEVTTRRVVAGVGSRAVAGDWSIYQREQLPVGFEVTGPAVIEEYASTLVIGAGDVATVGPDGALDIRIDTGADPGGGQVTSTQTGPATDPVTVEVVRNTLAAIADEMATDLQQGSYNMMIYEVRDFCCALLDKEGRLLSQNVGGVSHFVADLGVIITDALARFGPDGFKPGDGFLMNHQRVSGQHLNNVVTYTPVIIDGELFGFAMTRAHWSDIGGMSTGFGARGPGVDPWLEGLQLDQLKLIDEGVYDEKLLQVISDNIRFPQAALATCAPSSPPAGRRAATRPSWSSATAVPTSTLPSRRSSTPRRPAAEPWWRAWPTGSTGPPRARPRLLGRAGPPGHRRGGHHRGLVDDDRPHRVLPPA